jgi:superfamily II DNA or RNA helicase
MMVLKYLGIRELQELIGINLLERLELLLPILDSDEGNPTVIYKKSNLIKIFSSFLTTENLKDQSFLKLLLYSFPPEILDELCKEVGVKSRSDEFEKKVEKLIKLSNRRNFIEIFVNWSKLPQSLIPELTDRFPDSEESFLPSVPFKTLKDFQFTVFTEAYKHVQIPLSRFIIHMPTGSGKTRTSMEIITQYFNENEEPKTCIWLANTEELCDQAVECFKEVWSHVGKYPLNIFRCWGNNKGFPENCDNHSFVVAGFEKLSGYIKKNPSKFKKLKDKINIIIVDEAHHAIAPSYEETINYLIGKNSKLVGLTATPGRSAYNLKENIELSNFFFQKIIEIQSSEDVSVIEMLREKGILSKIIFEELKTNISYALTKKEINYIEQKKKLPLGFLNKLGADDLRNIEIVKKLRKELSEKRKTLFFGCSVEHSKFICSMMTYLGVKAVHIDGATDKRIRSQAIKDFKHGDLQLICNFGILSTGFDAPKTDLVFIARPTASLVLYSQMLGRGLRGPAIGGTKKCKIITVRDNIQGYKDLDEVYSYFEEYFQNN